MGTSTDGILCFGIPFDEGEFPYEDFEGGQDDSGPEAWLQSIINTEAGIVQPKEEWSEENKEEYRKVYKLEREAEKVFPIALTTHCSSECPMYILIIRGTDTKAWRGDPKEIDPSKMIVSPETVNVLQQFCNKYKIEWQQPKWYLCSYWG